MHRWLSTLVMAWLALGLPSAATAAGQCGTTYPLDLPFVQSFDRFVAIEYRLDGKSGRDKTLAYGHALGRLATAVQGRRDREVAFDCVRMAYAIRAAQGMFAVGLVYGVPFDPGMLRDTYQLMMEAAYGMHNDEVARATGIRTNEPLLELFGGRAVARSPNVAPAPAPAPAPSPAPAPAPAPRATATPAQQKMECGELDVWDARDTPIPRRGMVHACGDPDVPVAASWTFYSMSGVGGTYREKRDAICYDRYRYYTYSGNGLTLYQCDGRWMNCRRSPNPVLAFTQTESKDAKTVYRFRGGSVVREERCEASNRQPRIEADAASTSSTRTTAASQSFAVNGTCPAPDAMPAGYALEGPFSGSRDYCKSIGSAGHEWSGGPDGRWNCSKTRTEVDHLWVCNKALGSAAVGVCFRPKPGEPYQYYNPICIVQK